MGAERTWLERIAATACPTHVHDDGRPCFSDMFCASRIQAAEAAARADKERCQCGDFDNCDECLDYVQSTGRRP